VRTNIALDILGDYLSDSEVSILSQTFIEVEDPVTTDISFYTQAQLPCTISIHFESVPVEHLDSVEGQLMDVFRKVAKDGFDMERLAIVNRTLKNRRLLDVEESPARAIYSKLINEAMYGTLDGKTLSEDMKDLSYFDELAKWTSDQWVAVVQKYPAPYLLSHTDTPPL
jgi:Zn-dependent M16 (insulinase) family peptidase